MMWPIRGSPHLLISLSNAETERHGKSMEDFISLVTQQLGIGESEGKTATGGILKLVKDQLDEGTFSQLLEKLPGAEALVQQAESGSDGDGGGGLMGSLTSMAGGLLGGGEGGVADIAKTLGDAGIGLDKAPGFLSTLVSFLKDKLGEDMFSSLAAKLPDLLGGSEN